ncbi:MAG: polysaccharide deacetylase family protein [Defluviitaleaceae bacterium]|nr:polysaccharide deacetylase family protein [Defluviitaleaceae bacterium]
MLSKTGKTIVLGSAIFFIAIAITVILRGDGDFDLHIVDVAAAPPAEEYIETVRYSFSVGANGDFPAANLSETEYIARRLTADFDVKNIVISVSIDNFIYFDRSLSDSLADSESVGCLQQFLEANPAFLYETPQLSMPYIEKNIEIISRIAEICREAGADMFVILEPVFYSRFFALCEEEVAEMFISLAEVTPFWDFSVSSTISFDPRFFRDPTSPRAHVGVMAETRIFEYSSLFVPENFGVFVTSENAAQRARDVFEITPADMLSVSVPVLMYHDIRDDVSNVWQVTPEMFAVQMRALRDNGFNTVSSRCLVNFVFYGTPLPENPIFITFDDGYLSVYEYAFPVLEQYGHTATVFIIGHATGTFYYKDTPHRVTPKFCFDQARRMAHVVDIQSHTYDMHQWAPFEIGRARENILRWYDECEEEYARVLRNDHDRINARVYGETGFEIISLAFPHGRYDAAAQEILQSVGIRLTVSSTEGGNTVVTGLPQSLLSMNRLNIDDSVTAERLIEIISAN